MTNVDIICKILLGIVIIGGGFLLNDMAKIKAHSDREIEKLIWAIINQDIHSSEQLKKKQ